MKATIIVCLILLILLVALVVYITRPEWENMKLDQPITGRIPIAVLGDSDSHAYRDKHHKIRRGGDYHDVTFQWTEILARLRSTEIDLGQFGYWGTRGSVSRLRSKLGLDARTPRKQDFQYNFAFSGATCRALAPDSYQQQSYQLVKLMSKDPERWRNGLVIIRIGINDFGQLHALEKYAGGKLGAESRQPIVDCLEYISNAVELIRQNHSSVKIALIGIVDNSDLPYEQQTDNIGHARINKVLEIFDQGLMTLATSDPDIMFIEDRQWFSKIFGRWDPSGDVHLRQLSLGGSTPITNTQGDHPKNIVLADRHAGTVFNGLWIRNVLKHVNRQFGLGITPLLDSEIADLVDPHGDLGITSPDWAQNHGPSLTVASDSLAVTINEISRFRLQFEAADSAGNDISETATAFVETDSGEKLWLFGDGKELRFDPTRHNPGRHVLQIQVQDRYQQTAKARLPLTIHKQETD